MKDALGTVGAAFNIRYLFIMLVLACPCCQNPMLIYGCIIVSNIPKIFTYIKMKGALSWTITKNLRMKSVHR